MVLEPSCTPSICSSTYSERKSRVSPQTQTPITSGEVPPKRWRAGGKAYQRPLDFQGVKAQSLQDLAQCLAHSRGLGNVCSTNTGRLFLGHTKFGAEPQLETKSLYILSLLGHHPSMVGFFVLRWPRFKFLLCHGLIVAKLGRVTKRTWASASSSVESRQ